MWLIPCYLEHHVMGGAPGGFGTCHSRNDIKGQTSGSLYVLHFPVFEKHFSIESRVSWHTSGSRYQCIITVSWEYNSGQVWICEREIGIIHGTIWRSRAETVKLDSGIRKTLGQCMIGKLLFWMSLCLWRSSPQGSWVRLKFWSVILIVL